MTKQVRTQDNLIRDVHPELPLDPDAAQPGSYRWPPHFLPSLQVIVFIGGCLGTLTRYSIDSLVPVASNGWPMPTFIVNMLGAFLLGLLLETLTRRGSDQGVRQKLRLSIGTGFIGAFTTYSAFAVETVLLYKNNQLSIAILYLFTSLIAGLGFSALGIFVASRHHRTVTGAEL